MIIVSQCNLIHLKKKKNFKFCEDYSSIHDVTSLIIYSDITIT